MNQKTFSIKHQILVLVGFILLIQSIIIFLLTSYLENTMVTIGLSAVSFLGLGGITAFFITRWLSCLTQISEISTQLSTGRIPSDLSDYHPSLIQGAECSLIYQDLSRFSSHLIEMINHLHEVKEEANDSNKHLQNSVDRMSNQLNLLSEKANAALSDSQNQLDSSTASIDKVKEIINDVENFIVWSEENNKIMETSVTAIEEIFELFDNTSNHFEKARVVTNQLASLAKEGTGKVNRILGAMEGIRKAEDKIVSLVNIITNIAAQTNLLSMNASIEAAKAGTSGKGFSVVANEIRKLAANTAKSAEDVHLVIDEINETISTGQEATDEAVNALSQIEEYVVQNNSVFENIDQDNSKQEESIMLIASDLSKSVENATTLKDLSANLHGKMDVLKDLTETYKHLFNNLASQNQKVITEFNAYEEYAETVRINIKLNQLVVAGVNQLKETLFSSD